MQPCTSYCPPSRSPRESLGTNEYRVPHWVQKPSARPGCPSCPRPTGRLQSGLPQKRRPSGTCGLARIAAAGSPTGMRGMATTPAPSRPRVLPDFAETARAVVGDRTVELAGAVAAKVAVETVEPCGAAVSGAVPQTSQ